MSDYLFFDDEDLIVDDDEQVGFKFPGKSNRERLEEEPELDIRFADMGLPPITVELEELKKIELKEEEILIVRFDPEKDDPAEIAKALAVTFKNDARRVVLLPKGVELEKVSVNKLKPHPLY